MKELSVYLKNLGKEHETKLTESNKKLIKGKN